MRRARDLLCHCRWQWLTMAWLAVLMVGYLAMVAFDTRPGASPDPRSWWPADTHLKLARDEVTLVMFLHPECPCSPASVEELGRLLERRPSPAAAYVVMVDLRAEPGTLATQAGSIPGVILLHDRQGREARVFGCRTSGDLFVFDATGRLRFEGGITAARGHSGESAASAAAADAIDGISTAPSRMPVFGCPLF